MENGQIVLDEPIALPEGTVLDVIPRDHDMSAEELAELDAELTASKEEIERGEVEDARTAALRIIANL